MSLDVLLYLAGSIAGVALMVGLSTLLFGAKPARIAGRDAAVAHLAREVAGFRAGEAVVDSTGRAALVENQRDGTVHLVVVRGDGLVTRKLRGDSLRGCSRNGATLSLRLSDFTLPRATLALDAVDVAQAWQARLT